MSGAPAEDSYFSLYHAVFYKGFCQFDSVRTVGLSIGNARNSPARFYSLGIFMQDIWYCDYQRARGIVVCYWDCNLSIAGHSESSHTVETLISGIVYVCQDFRIRHFLSSLSAQRDWASQFAYFNRSRNVFQGGLLEGIWPLFKG